MGCLDPADRNYAQTAPNSTIDDKIASGYNITVRGFEINGNFAGNSETILWQGYFNLILFSHCNNVTVHNMYMHDGMGDGLTVDYCKKLSFTTIKYTSSVTMAFLPKINMRKWRPGITV